MIGTRNRRCTKCGHEGPDEGFSVDRTGRGGRRSTCKACQRVYAQTWREKNPRYHRAYHRDNWERFAISGAKRRARKQGLEFSITEEDIAVPSVCRICHVPLVIGGDSRTSPSVDRIVPSMGYVPENVWVICGECNRQKNDATPKKLRQIADATDRMVSTRGLVLPDEEM